MNLLQSLAKKAQEKASQAYDQVNVFDNGLSYKTRQVNPQARNRLWDQVNMLDNSRTWKQATPTNNQRLISQARTNVAQPIANATVVPAKNMVANTLVKHPYGMIQGFQQAYGTGQQGSFIDKLARVNNLYTKNVQSYGGSGDITKDIVAPGIETGLNIASFGTAGFGAKQFANEFSKQGFKQATKNQVPNLVTQAKLNAGQGAGYELYKDNPTLQGGATSAALSTLIGTPADIIGGGVLYGAAKGTGAIGKAVKNEAKLAGEAIMGNARPARLKDIEIGAISNYYQKLGTPDLDDQTYQQARKALNKVGINHTDTAAIDNLLGRFRTYENRKATLPSFVKPVSADTDPEFYKKNPHLSPDRAVSKFPERLLDEQRVDPIRPTVLRHASHEVLRNKDVLKKTANAIAKDEDSALAFAKRGTSTEANATGLQLLDKYLREGSFEKADELLDAIAPRFTRQGQETQILATYSRLTPAGAVRYAKRQIQKAGETGPKAKVVEETTDTITRQVNDIQDQAAKQIELDITGGRIASAKRTISGKSNKALTPEEMLAKRINATKGKKNVQNDPIKDMVDTLTKVAKETLPDKGKTLPRNPMELIGKAIKDKSQYGDVWEKAKVIVAEKYKNNPAALEELDKYFASSLVRPFSKSQLNKGVQQGLKDVDLGKLVRQHYTKVDEAGRTLEQKLIQEAGLDAGQARQLAGDIQTRFIKLTQAKKESIIKQMFGDSITPAQKSMADRVLEMSNLGALTRDDLRPLAGQKFGVPNLTQEASATITKMADNIQRLPEGSTERLMATQEMMNFITKQIPSHGATKAASLWRAGLLSGPITTAGNLLGNSQEAATRRFFTNPVATAADIFQSQFTGKRTKTLAGGGLAGTREGMDRFGRYMKTGYDQRNPLAKIDARQVNFGDGKVGKTLQAYNDGIYRWIGGQDQPFYYAAKNEAARDLAKADGINLGLKGKDLSDYINTSSKDINWQPQTFKTERTAADAGRFAVFQNETKLGSGAAAIKQWAHKESPYVGAVVDFLLPFTQVPSSIATRLVKRFDGGGATLLRELYRAKQGMGYDQRAVSEAIGNGMFGPSLIATGMALGAAGNLTYGFPDDPSERKLWELEGKKPYSVKIGDQWISMNYIQPAGAFLAIGGQMKDAIGDGENISSIASQMVATGGQSIMNQSFLKGISGVLDAIDNPKQYAENWSENTVGSVIPNFIRSTVRSNDNVQRETNGVLDGFKSGVPVARGTLNEKLDAFGRPIPAPNNFLNQWINPVRPSRIPDDSVVTELRVLENGGNGILPTDIKKNSIADNELNKDQIRQLKTAIGPKVYDAWNNIMADPQYKQLSDADKATVLKRARDAITDAGKRQFMAGNNIPIEKQASGNTRKVLEGQTPNYFSTSKSSSKDYYASKDAEYNTLKEQYDQKIKDGSYSTASRIRAESQLMKAEVGKDFDKNVRDLYGLSKAQAYNYVRSNPNGQNVAEQLIAYGDALVAAGINSYNKFRDRNGDVSIAPAQKKGRSSGSKGGRKSTSRAKVAKDKLPTSLASTISATGRIRGKVANAKIKSKGGRIKTSAGRLSAYKKPTKARIA